MQVLGSLIRLPRDATGLPLPWWHRAPLGLQSRTHCFVSIIQRKKRPVGDIIVSVNSEMVTANKSLPGIISEYGPGDTVTLTILRNGAETDVDIVLEQVP